ncbi:MAG: guanylate kinase [Candidatus Peregrinibacteria bacterium Gr01-1014_25]|nr:MAG: guanylate kinase [Candidatus Peregrinibacteria bacterium Gr01-1014_25]
MSPGKLVLLIGPSGVGKSVVLKKLRAMEPELHFPLSATTRPRRPREGDELYHFLTDAEFDASLKDGKFLEWAQVHGGPRYGTLIDEILPAIDAGKTVVREVDVQGFDSIRNHPLFAAPSPRYRLISLFLLPESVDQLIAHITKRAPMEQEELKRRLRSMERELGYAEFCTHRITSHEGKLDDVVREAAEIIRRS